MRKAFGIIKIKTLVSIIKINSSSFQKFYSSKNFSNFTYFTLRLRYVNHWTTKLIFEIMFFLNRGRICKILKIFILHRISSLTLHLRIFHSMPCTVYSSAYITCHPSHKLCSLPFNFIFSLICHLYSSIHKFVSFYLIWQHNLPSSLITLYFSIFFYYYIMPYSFVFPYHVLLYHLHLSLYVLISSFITLPTPIFPYNFLFCYLPLLLYILLSFFITMFYNLPLSLYILLSSFITMFYHLLLDSLIYVHNTKLIC